MEGADPSFYRMDILCTAVNSRRIVSQGKLLALMLC